MNLIDAASIKTKRLPIAQNKRFKQFKTSFPIFFEEEIDFPSTKTLLAPFKTSRK